MIPLKALPQLFARLALALCLLKGSVIPAHSEPIAYVSPSDLTIPEPTVTALQTNFFVYLTERATSETRITLNWRPESATLNSDFTPQTTTVVIPVGSFSATVPFRINVDSIFEGSEVFYLEIVSADPVPFRDEAGKATITDSLASFRPRIVAATFAESGAANSTQRLRVLVTFRRERPYTLRLRSRDLTAASASDFSAIDAALTFTPTEFSKEIDLTILGDNTRENTESFALEATDSDGAFLTRSIFTILDDDTGSVMPNLVWDDPQGSAHAPFPASLVARHPKGHIDTDITDTFQVYAVRGSRFSDVILTELQFNPVDGVELMNVSSSQAGIGGWRLYIYDQASWPAPALVHTFPEDVWLGASGIRTIVEPNASAISWFDNNAADTRSIAVLLVDRHNNIRDFVCAEAIASDIQDPFPIPPAEWRGRPTLAFQPLGLVRTGSENHRSDVDWLSTFTSFSFGARNTELSLPFPDSQMLTLSPATVELREGIWNGQLSLRSPASPISLMAIDGAGRMHYSQPAGLRATNDLSITFELDPPVLTHGSKSARFEFWVRNSGPAVATNVVVDLSNHSAPVTVSQGTVVRPNLVELGNLPPDGVAMIRIDWPSVHESAPTFRLSASVRPLAGEINVVNNQAEHLLPGFDPPRAAPASTFAWWPAELNSMDAFGNAPITMAPSVRFAEGLVGHAFELDGSHDPLQVVSSAFNIADTDSFAFEMWFRVDGDSPDGYMELARKLAADPITEPMGWRLYLDRGRLWLYLKDNRQNAAPIWISAYPDFRARTWNQASFYITRFEGVRVAYLRYNGGGAPFEGVPIGTGTHGNTAPVVFGHNLRGALDEIMAMRGLYQFGSSGSGMHGRAPRGIDADRNGIPDAWDFVAANGLTMNWRDSDGDGHLNWQEAYAGTFPSRADSVMWVSGASGADGLLRLTVNAEGNRNYQIQHSPTIGAGAAWSTIVRFSGGSFTDPNLRSFSVPNVPGAYRVIIP